MKTLVIRMLTELVECVHKIEGKMKAMKSEKRKMYREPTVKGRKPGLKSMVWTRRKKQTFNQNRMKKQEFKNVRRGLGTSGTALNVSASSRRGAGRRGRARS